MSDGFFVVAQPKQNNSIIIIKWTTGSRQSFVQ